MAEVDRTALSIATGAAWATFVWTIAVVSNIGLGRPLVDVLSSLYCGYDSTISGSVIGAMWGFVDGALAGYMIATIYNRLLVTEPAAVEGESVPVHVES